VAERGRPRKVAVAELPPAPEWRWKVSEIARFHQLTPAAIIAAINRGELQAEQPGKGYRIRDSWYREWLRSCRVPGAARAVPSPAAAEPPARVRSGRRSFFSEGGQRA
jgi:hypothetical protein